MENNDSTEYNDLTENNNNQTENDIQQNIEIKKNKTKIDIALIFSGLALLISVIQLVITSPFFIDIYNSPKIIVDEGENICTGTPMISNNYQLYNESNKTATNLTLAIDAYCAESISFIPENSFKLTDSIKGFYYFNKRYIYTKSNLIPNERITVTLLNRIDTIAKRIGTDTLKPNIAYNCQHLVPNIAELKSDLGFAKVNRAKSFIIESFDIKTVGHYKLIGKPLEK